jgi:hypothetical protein
LTRNHGDSARLGKFRKRRRLAILLTQGVNEKRTPFVWEIYSLRSGRQLLGVCEMSGIERFYLIEMIEVISEQFCGAGNQGLVNTRTLHKLLRSYQMTTGGGKFQTFPGPQMRM